MLVLVHGQLLVLQAQVACCQRHSLYTINRDCQLLPAQIALYDSPECLHRYCAGGNLRRLLSDPSLGPPLLWRNGGRRLALDAARGLAYLHSCGVLHRWALQDRTNQLAAGLAGQDLHINFAHSRQHVTKKDCRSCRDIKSSNILLNCSGRAKVADGRPACHLNTMGLNGPKATFVSISPDRITGFSCSA